MTLYNSHTDFAVWRGEPINDVMHPLIIEKLWSDNELIDVGLYKESMIVNTPVPEGKLSIGKHVEVIEGVPTWVHDLIDTPTPEVVFPILKPYQFWAVMKATGHEQGLRAWVDSLNNETSETYDPVAWATASAIIDYSLEYRRDHPIVEAARSVMGVTVEQLDDLWLYAASL